MKGQRHQEGTGIPVSVGGSVALGPLLGHWILSFTALGVPSCPQEVNCWLPELHPKLLARADWALLAGKVLSAGIQCGGDALIKDQNGVEAHLS